MNTVGIVATTVVIALFVFALLASAGVLIWVAFKARKEIIAFQSSIAASIEEVNDVLTTHREYMLKGLESASASHHLLSEEIRTTLKSHGEMFNAQITRINGEALQAASKEAISAARRIEVAAVAFGELSKHLLSRGEDERDVEAELNSLLSKRPSQLAPDAYAPNPTGERWTGISSVVAGDNEALEEESRDVEPRFPHFGPPPSANISG